MTTASDDDAPPQSAAAPSPFPPIADYAFLSNCHTGSLIAPDGSVDWLCVPRFDSPSVFGSLLDREAGMFRFGPFGINVPSARQYEPGTQRPRRRRGRRRPGWVVVRDALTMGPSRGVGHGHAAHTAAGRRRRRAHAGPDGRVPRRQCRDGAGVRAGVRLRAGAGDVAFWSTATGTSPTRAAPSRTLRLQHRPARRHRGRPGSRPPRAGAG